MAGRAEGNGMKSFMREYGPSMVQALLASVIALGAWITVSTIRAEAALTVADETRIKQDIQSHVSSQFDKMENRIDRRLSSIDAQLEAVRTTQTQILLELQK